MKVRVGGLAVIAIVLSVGATLLLGVPSLGNPGYYWLSLGLTVFSAVGLGFALSTTVETESQAVQPAVTCSRCR